MKKYIYLFAIIILFPLTPLPFGERIEVRGHFFSAPSLTLNTDTDTYTYTMIRGLLLPSLAEAYTYQDVENEYNNAKTQYPNDYIWIEEFNQDGKKGYKIWRRPVPGPLKSDRMYQTEPVVRTATQYMTVYACKGTSGNHDVDFILISPGSTYYELYTVNKYALFRI
ncbi:MAG: hypothetical protein HY096_15360 [Nitrospinae bacterium]|nr:hypothetical protein [Nitrospinota bacterium]